ncbi:MAG: hypothetical protein ACFFD4_26470 [Candidatus Odinarchaeota archaeon]
MPFTPFHFGIALLIFAVFPFLDPVALFIGAVIPDTEGILAMFVFRGAGLPLHGVLHSFLAATVLGIVTGLVSYLLLRFAVEQKLLPFKMTVTVERSVFSGLLGTFSHILLDVPLYSEMDPFLPLTGNPLYGIVPFSVPYAVCILGAVLGTLLILVRVYWKAAVKKPEKQIP